MTTKDKVARLLLVWLLLALLVVLSAGCATSKLRPDPSAPATEANYPTAEFEACGATRHGLAVCSLTQGEPLDKVGLKIKGYFDGEVRVDAAACGVAARIPYEDSALIPVSIPGVAAKDCVITFRVSPVFPDQRKNDRVVFPLKGQLLIKVLRQNDAWIGEAFKAAGEWSLERRLWVGDADESVSLFLNGCGKDLARRPFLTNGYLVTDVKDAASYGVHDCALDGVVVHPLYQDLRLSYLISQYSPGFQPLQAPEIQMKEVRTIILTPAHPESSFQPVEQLTLAHTELTVLADPAVTVVMLDNEVRVTNHARFRFTPSRPHTLRLLTVKGRSTIGLYDPKKGAWQWMN